MGSDMKEAIEAFRKGEFVIVYDADGREEECDFFLPAESCKSDHIRTMRKEGGGLIFLMVRPDVRDRLGLPFLQDVFPRFSREYPLFRVLISDDIPYDTRSSFSIAINHRETFTGITDIDRSLTVREFGKLSRDALDLESAEALSRFGEHFRTPGHIPLCIGSDRILETRFGHTELSCALSTMAGMSGVSVGCEIMGENGKAMPKNEVMEYAKENGIPFLVGQQIIDAWREWDGSWKKDYVPPANLHPRRNEAKSEDTQSISVPEKRGRRVMATGVFDIIHPGHLHFLKMARSLGDELIVVIARDSTVEDLKRHPVMSERARREMVASLDMVDGAYLGYESDRLRIVREIGPDIIALGYDQKDEEEKISRDLEQIGMDVEVVRIDKRSGDISATSEILEKLREAGECR
jgi:3,4-dihydroxy 2-butanone 4-phosphate synthase